MLFIHGPLADNSCAQPGLTTWYPHFMELWNCRHMFDNVLEILKTKLQFYLHTSTSFKKKTIAGCFYKHVLLVFITGGKTKIEAVCSQRAR